MAKFVDLIEGKVIVIDDTKLALAIDLADREDMDALVYEDGSIHLLESNEKGNGGYVRVSSFGVEDAERCYEVYANEEFMGVFSAKDEDGAKEALHIDAGYSGSRQAAAALGITVEKLNSAVEVRAI